MDKLEQKEQFVEGIVDYVGKWGIKLVSHDNWFSTGTFFRKEKKAIHQGSRVCIGYKINSVKGKDYYNVWTIAHF